MVFNDAYQILGFIGGCMFPIATAVQTYTAFSTRSTEDISYGWQGVYGLAEVLYIIYSAHFKLWVLLIPCSVELALLAFMVLGKIYFDHFYKGKRYRAGGASSPPAKAIVKRQAPDESAERQSTANQEAYV